MYKRFLFTLLSIIVLASFVLYVNPATALNNCTNCTECPYYTECPNCTDCPNCTECPNQGDQTRTQARDYNNCDDCPNCTDCPNCSDCPNQGDPVYAQYRIGSMAPPWSTDSDSSTGGPIWLTKIQGGYGPWFWQAYNGFDVTGIAPVWYNTDGITYSPAWLDGSSQGPWWSFYIMDDPTNSGSLSRFRSNSDSNNNMNYQYGGSIAPPWSVVDPENSTGGPSWLSNNPVQGVGPWFWQVYNGFVPDNAPIWYLNYPNATYMPAWLDGSSQGPWWSSYISESLE